MHTRGVHGAGHGRRSASAPVAAPPAAAATTATPDPAPASSTADAELTPVKLQLQWVAQAQFAGYYAAVDQGYYEDEGLDVEIVEGGADIVPQDVLRPATSTTRSRGCRRCSARSSRAPRSPTSRRSSSAARRPRSRSRTRTSPTPADLEGKKVGSWGFGNEWELFAGMQKAGVDASKDIELVQQAFDMNALPRRRHRRRPGDDLQRVRAGAGDREPGHRRAVPARGPQRHQLERRRAPPCSRTPSGRTPTKLADDAAYAGPDGRSSSRPRSRAGSTPATTPRRRPRSSPTPGRSSARATSCG